MTNTTFWEYLGDYSSLGEMVTALAFRVDAVETSVEEINGELAAMASRIIGVEAVVNPRMAGGSDWRAGGTEVRAGSWSIYSAFGAADLAIAQRIDKVDVSINDVRATVTDEIYARVTADEAWHSRSPRSLLTSAMQARPSSRKRLHGRRLTRQSRRR